MVRSPVPLLRDIANQLPGQRKKLTTMEFGGFINVYFELGLKYSDIKSILASRHAFHISERHLKRILRDRGHSRRKAYSDLSVLVDFISDQLQ